MKTSTLPCAVRVGKSVGDLKEASKPALRNCVTKIGPMSWKNPGLSSTTIGKRCPSLAQNPSESFCQPLDWRISAVLLGSGASTGYFFSRSAQASANGIRFGNKANGKTDACPEPL